MVGHGDRQSHPDQRRRPSDFDSLLLDIVAVFSGAQDCAYVVLISHNQDTGHFPSSTDIYRHLLSVRFRSRPSVDYHAVDSCPIHVAMQHPSQWCRPLTTSSLRP